MTKRKVSVFVRKGDLEKTDPKVPYLCIVSCSLYTRHGDLCCNHSPKIGSQGDGEVACSARGSKDAQAIIALCVLCDEA